MLVNFNYKNLGFRCKLAASILLRDLVEMTTRVQAFSPRWSPQIWAILTRLLTTLYLNSV